MERDLGSGATGEHELQLAAGTYLALEVSPIGADVGVSLIDPEGRSVAAGDGGARERDSRSRSPSSPALRESIGFGSPIVAPDPSPAITSWRSAPCMPPGADDAVRVEAVERLGEGRRLQVCRRARAGDGESAQRIERGPGALAIDQRRAWRGRIPSPRSAAFTPTRETTRKRHAGIRKRCDERRRATTAKGKPGPSATWGIVISKPPTMGARSKPTEARSISGGNSESLPSRPSPCRASAAYTGRWAIPRTP